MKATDVFQMRVSPAIKSRLKAAAKREGRSLANFILQAAMQAAAAQPLKKQAAP